MRAKPPGLRHRSLRTETLIGFSAAPLASSGPGRSRLPAGTGASRKSRGEGYAQAPAGSRCLPCTREVFGEPLPRLCRRSLRTETLCDSSVAPLASPGPSRCRLPAGTGTSANLRHCAVARSSSAAHCMLRVVAPSRKEIPVQGLSLYARLPRGSRTHPGLIFRRPCRGFGPGEIAGVLNRLGPSPKGTAESSPG